MGGGVNLVEPGSIEEGAREGSGGVRYAWDGRMLH
jgi:hypothetical protein